MSVHHAGRGRSAACACACVVGFAFFFVALSLALALLVVFVGGARVSSQRGSGAAHGGGKKVSSASDTARCQLCPQFRWSCPPFWQHVTPRRRVTEGDSYSFCHSNQCKGLKGLTAQRKEGDDTIFVPFLVNSPPESFTLNMR